MVHDTFGEVIDAYQAGVLRYLRRLPRSVVDAEDLFQETFLRAFRAFGRLGADANSRAWVYRIATNVFFNHRRSQRRHPEMSLTDQLPGRALLSADRADRKALGRMYRTAILGLPHRQRVAFVQRRLCGWSYGEVAKAMGGTEATARANVSQAARRLRRELVGKEKTT
jgi:RNA polymerase sigma-70 factor (ECF subfamily)